MKKTNGRFYCFSPPVMLATFIIEIGLLFYTLFRYKMNTLLRITSALLFFLAVFQLAEYNVCGGFGASATTWSRIGFVAITMLPALGIHLLQTVSGRGWRGIKWLAYGMSMVWVVVFAFSQSAFSGHTCAGNYVIFQLKPSLDGPYFVYYFGWLLAGIYLCAYFARTAKLHIRQALLLQILGYLVFLLPAIIVNSVKPETMAGRPSVMCGFAVLYALIIVFGIIPEAYNKSVANKSRKD